MKGRTKGQIYSADFAISLAVFAIGAILAFTLAVNTLSNDDFDKVNDEAITAANLLVTSGYPQHWYNGSVIRSGLASDGHLSLRKTTEFAKLTPSKLRQSLQVTDNIYIYITNQSNDTIGIFGSCGMGDLSVNSTPANTSLPAASINTIVGPVTSQLGIQSYAPQDAYTNLTSFDVLLIEGNISSSTSGAAATLLLEAAAARGITIFIIGDPGLSAFGISTNTTGISSVTINGTAGAEFGFGTNELIATSANVPILVMQNNSLITNFTVIGTTDTGGVAYASWIFNDAKVWYFGTSAGNAAAGSVASLLAASVNRSIDVSRPVCAGVVAPTAKHVALHTRSLPYHAQLLTLNVLTWRTT